MKEKRKIRLKRKPVIIACIVVVLSVVVYLIYSLLQPDPTGIYLSHGGVNYYRISKRMFGGLDIETADNEYTEGVKANRSFGKVRILYRHGRDIFDSLSIRKILSIGGNLNLPSFLDDLTFGLFGRMATLMRLVPSETVEGDWDLTVYHPFFAYGVKDSSAPLTQPVPSYLHKIDDERIPDFFDTLIDGEDAEAAIAIARDILVDYPDDLHVKTLLFAALLEHGEFEEVAGLFNRCRDEYLASDNVCLVSVGKNIDRILTARKYEAAGENAHEYIMSIFRPSTEAMPVDLDSYLQSSLEIFRFKTFMSPHRDSLKLGFGPSGDMSGWVSFLNVLVITKVVQTEAMFRLIRGERREALELLAAQYYLVCLLEGSPDARANRLIGAATKWISASGLMFYALNACETEQDLAELWKVLEKLRNTPQRFTGKECADITDPLGQFVPGEKEVGTVSNFTQMQTSGRMAETRFEFVRMATAAKYSLFAHGAFPVTTDDFAPLLPDGPPRDPFSSEALKFINDVQNDRFTCYSVGPDRIDNEANISYDATNGTISSGDVYYSIPLGREYPFPRNGIKANTAEEVRAMFPEGLPVDNYSGPAGAPLGISDTTPVYIWSFGPDMDRGMDRTLSDNGATEIMYDPTNGIISEGDVFFEVPMRE